MKKVTRIISAICMMSLLTFVSTSCKKDQDNAGMEVISAEVETFSVDGERAYIEPDNYNFLWHEEDYVRVFNLSSQANQSRTSVFYKFTPGITSGARFRGPSVGNKMDVGYRLFYPVNMFKYKDDEQTFMAQLGNENRTTFTVATTQEFNNYSENGHISSVVDPEAMPMAIDPEKLAAPATFRQMFGVAAISFKAGMNKVVVVDSLLLTDKTLPITGDVTLRLDRVAVEDPVMGPEHNLIDVWNAFEANGWDDNFASALAEELSWLSWSSANTGHSIMMNCLYAKEGEEEPTGVQLANAGGNVFTDFNFMLRPCALYNGFTVTLYIHNFDDPTTAIVKSFDSDNHDFFYGNSSTPDFNWGIKRAKIKNFRYPTAVAIEE